MKQINKKCLFLIAMMMSLVSFGLNAQNEIKGKVVDKSGVPLPGASILIQNTTKGTTTDFDGFFKLEAREGDVLVITYIGYEKQLVTITNETNYTIVLNDSSGFELNQIVVTGYSSQSKRDITGAVSSIKSDDLLSVPSVGVSESMQGRVAGVTIGQEGGPGGGTSVRIRGFGTVGNNDPLYVIDGTPTKSGLNDLNPNDIESIQVLKDASAASIYGARAGNGVVIVTTKSGKSGKTKLTANMYYGSQIVPELPGVLNAQQFADMLWTAQINEGQSPSHPHFGSGSTPTIPSEFAPGVPVSVNGTNWLSEIFNNAPVESYNIGATGGSDNGSYAFSGGYVNQEGILIHTGYKRYTARSNTSFKISDKITVGQNLTVSYSTLTGIDNQSTENPVSMAIRMPSVLPVRDTNGNFAGTNVGGFNNPQNPVGALFRNRFDKDKRFRTFGNAYLEVELLEGLKAKTSIGIDYLSSRRSDFTGLNFEDAEVVGANKLDEYALTQSSYTWFNTLTYTKSNDKHDYTVLIGTEAIGNNTDQIFGSRTSFFDDDPNYRVLSAGAGGIGNGAFKTESRLFSVFGKVDYNYDDLLLLSATIRRDGSSRFGSNNRYGIFPAFSAGIRLTEFEGINKHFDDLKFRVGWGKTGNQEIGDFSSFTLFASDVATTYYDIQGTNGSSVSGFATSSSGNEDVKWETTTSTNIGIDGSLLDHKLGFSLDWYTKKTTDMLIQVPLPATAGFVDPPFVNVGEMTNTGIDLAINYRDEIDDFKYDIGFNISSYKNNIDRLGDNPDFAIAGAQARSFRLTRTQVGSPLSYFYGLDVEGIFNTEAEVSASADQGFSTPSDGLGRFKYRDVNGDGTIDQNDRTLIGNPHPDFTYGFNVNLAYKNFDFTLFLQGSQGNDLYNFTKYFSDFSGVFFQSGKGTAVLDAWSPSNPNGSVPALSSGTPNKEVEPNSYFVEDGSYLRFKNVQLGYTLPSSITDKWGLSKLRLFIQGKNLFTFTKYSGLDPELSLRSFSESDASSANLDIGVDRGAYPVAKTILMGLNIDL